METNRRQWILFLLSSTISAAALSLGSPTYGQTPVGREFRVNQSIALTEDEGKVAVGQDGQFAVTWRQLVGDTIPFSRLVAIRFYDQAGNPLGGELHPDEHPSGPFALLPQPSGGYRLAWGGEREGKQNFVFQNYSAEGVSQEDPLVLPFPDDRMLVTNIVPATTGMSIVSWIAAYLDPGPGVFPTEVKVAYLAPDGQYLRGGPISISFDPKNIQFIGDVGVDGRGNVVVVWAGECGPEHEEVCDVFAQRLSATGDKLGGPIRVNEVTAGLQDGGKVAVAPDGTFLVVWESTSLGDPDGLDVYCRLFSAAGEPIGRELRVNTTAAGLQWVPAVAADPFGNFAVVWASFRRENGFYGWDVHGRMFRHDGTPVATELRLNSTQTHNEFTFPQLAFGGNGTLVAVWQADDGDFDGVFAQRFAASPADEPCVVSGRRLLCDTARTGGEAEIDISLPVGSRELVLLGDVDGDGRADPCVHRGRRFLCDVEHRGEHWTPLPAFGSGGPGETPLLGDVDGDGRADVCVFANGRFTCDTGHGSGATPTVIRFGRRGDRALLGDVDGDGRADPCVVRNIRLLCDTVHDGGAAEVSIPFNAGRETPLLGDFDGDGRADPCIFDGRRFLCDTAHGGTAPRSILAFGHAGDQPLLGNLDGV